MLRVTEGPVGNRCAMSEFHHEVGMGHRNDGPVLPPELPALTPAKDAIFMNIVYGVALRARGRRVA